MFKLITASLLLVAGAVVVVAPGVPKPGITVSNRLTPAKDARVLVFTMTPKTTWAGPYTWHTSINGTDTVTTVDAAVQMRDTVFQAFPTCAEYRATVFPATVNGVVKRDSLTKKVSVCRAATKRELAFADSFPAGSLRVLICGKYQYTALDTAIGGPPWRDSTLIGTTGDTTVLFVGRTIHIGATLKNRYTGRVALVSGDPLRCEAGRAFRESERGT